MDLDKPSTLLPVDIFRSICECKTELRNYSIPKHLPSSEQGKEIVLCALMPFENENSLSLRLELKDNRQSLDQGKKIVLRALSVKNEISLSLWLETKDNGQSVILGKLGTYRIGEDMQNFLHSSFLRLCIYTFLGVTQENINAVLKGLKPEKKKKTKENELLSLNFKQKEIGKSSFETAFNNLFIAVCYSGLINQDSVNKNLKDKMKELAFEMLEKIGKSAAHSLIISLAFKRNQIHSEYKKLEMDGLTIAYSSVISKSISCYCTRLEMDKKRYFGYEEKNLADKLNRKLFYCELGLDRVVENNGDDIKVKHTISFLHYKPIQLNSSTNSNERYFPAKISIKIWPEGDFEFMNLLMGDSTPDPSVTVTNTKCGESGLQLQLGTGGAGLTLGTKCNCSTAHTLKRTCWKRNREEEDPGVGRQDWILEHNISGVSAFDYKPRNSSGAAAYKALAGLAGSDGPLTESGGINFEGKERCGPPMTWTFKRPPLKWAVEVEIEVAYYSPEYKEVRSKKFGGISLVHARGTSAPHTTEQQVPPVAWLLAFSILLIWVFF